MQSAAIWKRIGIFLLAASATLAWWPRPAVAHGRSHDPRVRAERQHRHAEEQRTKRRQEIDLNGAEVRDAKKSAQESRQSQTQTELGPVNP
jgi:hypothetical protein